MIIFSPTILFIVTSSLRCYKCYSEMSAFHCIYKQQVVTCEAGFDSCATFSEMYLGKKVYHKLCKNSNLTCEALCTSYQKNGRKCLETDKVTTSLCLFFVFMFNIHALHTTILYQKLYHASLYHVPLEIFLVLNVKHLTLSFFTKIVNSF